MNDFSFSVFNKFASDGVSEGLSRFNVQNKKPIFVCIGSDLVLGDSLGPLTGTWLKRLNSNIYVYGTLNVPITAKEIECCKKHLTFMHPNSVIIAIDAAVGVKEDVGTIRVLNRGIKPGLGVCKDLDVIGDISIIGVVSERSNNNHSLYNLTRLNLIYKMSEVIASGIEKYCSWLNCYGERFSNSF